MRSTPAMRSLDRTSMRALGKQRRDLLGEALDAGAAGDERVASRRSPGRRRPRHRDGRNGGRRARAEAVLDQPGVAVRALEAMAAGAAQRQRRIAAPVEEQQRLLACAASARCTASASRGARKRPRGGSSRVRSIAAIDRQVLRRRSAPAAQPAIAARARIDPRLDRGRGRGQHDRESSSARAPPPCRGRGSARRPPACRRRRAPHRRR